MTADFELSSSSVGDILVVTFTGESTEKNAQAMIRRYFEIVLGSGMRKVLADIRLLKGRLSGANTYFIVRNLPVKPVPPDVRTAIVESRGNRAYADFLETTAANAGVYFASFLDYDEALAWLGKPDSAQRG